MSDHVVIKLRSEGSAADAKGAALMKEGTNHAFKKSGKQGWSLDLGAVDPGEYTLCFRPDRRPTLNFSVEVKQKGEKKSIGFVKLRPLCCKQSRQSAAAGSNSSRRLHVLTFEIGDAHSEVVFVVGWNYMKKIDYLLDAETWRDDLYRGKSSLASTEKKKKTKTISRVLFEHSVVSIFHMESGFRIRQIRGKKGWHEMDRVLQGAVPTHKDDPKGDEGNRQRHVKDSISILHAFDHVTKLGANAPGSLKRLDFYGHAWKQGPVLINTSEREEFREKSERDPQDKDGRAHKDFEGISSNFKKAFANDAECKLWGCSYIPHWRTAIQKAARMKDKDKVIGNEFTANDVRDLFKDTLIPNSYMGKLAAASGATCWGVPLGLGSQFVKVGKKRRYQKVTANVPLEYRWWKDEIGKTPDDGGYIPYDP